VRVTKRRAAHLLVFFLLIALCTLTMDAAWAGGPAAGSAHHPKTIVLLTSDLTWDDMGPAGDLLVVRRLASIGGVALLNTTVSGQPTESAAYLTVGAGERVAAPAERGPQVTDAGVPLSIGEIAAQESLPANALEGNAVRPVYVRRFGVEAPADAVAVDIALPLLQRAQSAPDQADAIGALGDTLRRSGQRVGVFGDWRAVLTGMDRLGAVYHGSAVMELTPSRLAAALQESDVVIAAAGGGRLPLRILTRAALPLAERGLANVIVVCACPPIDPVSDTWRRLGFVVAAGPAFTSHSVLTSPTTRTLGLVANIDIAPTILAAQGVAPLPVGDGVGHAMRSIPVPAPLETVAALDRRVVATDNATTLVLVGYGAFTIASCLFGLLCILQAGQISAASSGGVAAKGAEVVITALRIAAAGPLAFLFTGLAAPGHIWQYGALFAAIALTIALAADLVGAWTGVSPIGLVLTLTTAAVVLDAVFGSPLVGHALMSGYALPGLRFYGVGNEYMALTIGATLAGFALLAPSWLGAAGLVLALLLGMPSFGANGAGAFLSVLTLVMADLAIRADRRSSGSPSGTPGRTRLLQGLAAAAAGLAMASICVLVDRMASAETRSHLADLPVTPDAWAAVLSRKAARCLQVSLSGWTLAALVTGAAPIGALLAGAGPVRARFARTLDRRPALRSALPAALCGALAALLFTDSGLAAALLLLAPVTVTVLHEMLDD
jgi:hypothetical protein